MVTVNLFVESQFRGFLMLSEQLPTKVWHSICMTYNARKSKGSLIFHKEEDCHNCFEALKSLAYDQF